MKKALKIAVDVLAWIVLIAAFLVTIMVFSSQRNDGIPNLLGIMPMSVQSESMNPTFKEGDLIFIKETDLMELKKDDVITFFTIIQGNRVLNTHRIVEINESGSSKSFTTKGDNNPIKDELTVYPADIVGIWTGAKIPGGGRVIDFLRTKTGFFVCILIPMAIFFLFELYKFIVVLIEAKKPKMSEEEEEEIKKKAIEEYLAKEKAKEQEQNNGQDAVQESVQAEETAQAPDAPEENENKEG